MQVMVPASRASAEAVHQFLMQTQAIENVRNDTSRSMIRTTLGWACRDAEEAPDALEVLGRAERGEVAFRLAGEHGRQFEQIEVGQGGGRRGRG